MLSFTGAATTNGILPAGTYDLNFIGNSVVANGRALDAAGTGGPSNISIEFTATGTATGDADFDNDGDVDGSDFLAWQRGFGTGTTNAEGDADGDGDVDGTDLAQWTGAYGSAPVAALQQPVIVEPSVSDSVRDSVAPPRRSSFWITLDTESEVKAAAIDTQAIAEAVFDAAIELPELADAGSDFETDIDVADDADAESSVDEAFAELGELLFA